MKKSALSLSLLCFLSFSPFTCLAAQNSFVHQEDPGFDCTPTHTPPLSLHDQGSYDPEEYVLIDEEESTFLADSNAQPVRLPDHFIAPIPSVSQLHRVINTYINPMLRSSQWYPDDILLILDFDGTITNKPHPDDQGDLACRVSGIKEWIFDLLQAGVHIIVSSAWNQAPWTDATGFHHTCERLIQLGLGDVLLGEERDSYQEVTLQTTTIKDVDVSFIKAGHVCSVIKGVPTIENRYFFNKAFAGACVLGEKTEKLKRVIFIEDSPGNADVFEKDVRECDLFPAAGVYRYLLGRDKACIDADTQATLDQPFCLDGNE